MFLSPKKIFLLPILFFFLTTACLDEQEAQVPDEAAGEIEIILSDAASGQPLGDFEFFILLEITGFSQPATINQPFETDASGFMATPIYSLTEDHITGIIVEYDVNGETRSAEQDVDLELRFEEPFNSVSVEFELNVEE